MKTKSLDLFVFVDALGWKIAEKRKILADILPFRQACRTLFGYSCTCDPSILTGKLPKEHRHFSFFVYAPEKSPFHWAKSLSLIPAFFGEHHRVRNRVSRYVAKKCGYTGYFQLYSVPFSILPYLDYTEKKDIYELGGIIGGYDNIFKYWQDTGIPWFKSNWRLSDQENIMALGQQIDKGHIRLGYLFNAGLDAAMHKYGIESTALDPSFDQFEKWIREIWEKAHRNYETLRLHIFSDHGMSQTLHQSNLLHEFTAQGWKYGRDYGAVWDSTMLRLWPGPDAKIRQEMNNFLKTRREGRILEREELDQDGCYFEDSAYGEIIFLLNNNTLFIPSYMNKGLVNGMHGYHPDEKDSDACWLTSYDCDIRPRRIEEINQVMKVRANEIAY